MAKDHSADLMQCLVSKLYSTITGDDKDIKLPRNKFVTWFLPGLPFDVKDFLYCAKGFGGETAEEIQQLYHQAFALSKLFDFIPDVNNEFFTDKMQQTIFTTTQDTISSVYKDILEYSRVYHSELGEEDKKKLERFRNLLSVTKEKEDLITGEKKQVTEPGPLTVAYNTYMNNYLDEVDVYMNLKIAAASASGDDPEAKKRVHEWANKAQFLRKKMEAADLAWVTQGYKNEYEEIGAYIRQITQRSMVLYKEDLQNKLKYGVLNSPIDGGSDFYYTTLIPGNFATSPGWTRFSFYEGDYESHYKKNTSQWSAGGNAMFGLFSIGAKAKGSKVEISTNQKSTNLKAELEFTQVPICRPWFEPGFFWMRAWTLGKLWDLNYDKEVSDGEKKPDGRLVAYPITALFVRNVKFTFDEADAQSKYVNKNISAGGKVGWGPFSVGGSYSKGSETRDFHSHVEGGAVEIPGIQLIGTINNIVPKCPDTHPDLKPEDFVGGGE
jgi:hypothetical protein